MLKFEFIQPGEFEDPYYDVQHEDGDSLGILHFDGMLWLSEFDSLRLSSRILDEVSNKLKELNKWQ